MKKYKYRYLKTISAVINIAYLTTAISWGIASCSFNSDKSNLKNSYSSDKISHEEFLAKSQEFTDKEEKIFKHIANGFVLVFATDVAFAIITNDKEY